MKAGIKWLAAATLTASAWIGTAQAAVIYTNDRTGFEAGLTNLIVDDYEAASYEAGDKSDFIGLDVHTNTHMSSILGETSYTSTYHDNSNIINQGSNNYYCAGCNGSFLLDFTSTSIGTASGVGGVGFNFFNSSSGAGAYYAFVTFGDGSTANYLMPLGDIDTDFWGITSDLLISFIHIGLQDGVKSSAQSFAIDNLTIGNAAELPEPATLALFGIGLAGLGLARRRRAAQG